MEKEFVSYEQALALKELGFDEPCFGDYYKFDNNDIHLDTDDDRHRIITDNKDEVIIEISAPLFQQAFRWFREKHDKYGVVNIDLSNNLKDKIFVYMVEDKLGYFIDRSEEYNTYEEAESACLDKLIELVKTK
jgi:hypothetical protein